MNDAVAERYRLRILELARAGAFFAPLARRRRRTDPKEMYGRKSRRENDDLVAENRYTADLLERVLDAKDRHGRAKPGRLRTSGRAPECPQEQLVRGRHGAGAERRCRARAMCVSLDGSLIR
jgi:hypothetical protein